MRLHEKMNINKLSASSLYYFTCHYTSSSKGRCCSRGCAWRRLGSSMCSWWRLANSSCGNLQLALLRLKCHGCLSCSLCVVHHWMLYRLRKQFVNTYYRNVKWEGGDSIISISIYSIFPRKRVLPDDPALKQLPTMWHMQKSAVPQWSCLVG